MKCTKCDNELREGAIFCDKCGSSQNNIQMPSSVPEIQCCIKCSAELIGGSKFCDRCGTPQMQNAVPVQQQAYQVPPLQMQTPAMTGYTQNNQNPPESPKSRGTYILLCFFFGGLGFHNFYAGYVGRGVAQLLLSWTGISSLWAFIELFAVSKDAQGRLMNRRGMTLAVCLIIAITIMLIVGIYFYVKYVGYIFYDKYDNDHFTSTSNKTAFQNPPVIEMPADGKWANKQDLIDYARQHGITVSDDLAVTSCYREECVIPPGVTTIAAFANMKSVRGNQNSG